MKRNGFTLTELAMVCVIIGILSAIIIPKFMYTVQSSGDPVTKENIRKLREALEVYKARNGHYPTSGLAFETEIAPDYIRVLPDSIVLTDAGVVRSNEVAQGSCSCGENGGWCYIYSAVDDSYELEPDSNKYDFSNEPYCDY